MRQGNPKGRYIEGEIGKGNTHTKSLQVSLELYIILCYTFSVCVCVCFLLCNCHCPLIKALGREGNLNVYLTWLWLIPNWAYSIYLVTLSVPVCIFYSPCFIFSILCSEMARRTIHYFLVEAEATTCLQMQDLWRTNLFLFFMHIIWNYLYNVVPGYMPL